MKTKFTCEVTDCVIVYMEQEVGSRVEFCRIVPDGMLVDIVVCRLRGVIIIDAMNALMEKQESLIDKIVG